MKINEDGEYLCPYCESNFTHHETVEVFGREEDDEKPNHIIVDRYEIKIDRNNKNNPSTRRESVSIRFSCEQCGRIHYLTFAQHKGNTQVEIKDNSVMH
jgi:ribosomal protein L44E